jgi:mono/diheme cytochrome c family protein
LEQRTDLNVDYIKYIVRHGLKTMPGFKPTTLTEPELDALADYLKQ